MAGTGAKGMPADDSSSCLLLDCLQSVPQARELVFQALGPLDLLRLADVRTGSRQLRHWGQATLNGPNMTQLAMVGGLVRTLPPVLPPRRHVRADQITSSDDDDDQSSEDDQSSGSDGSEFDSNSLSSDHSDGSEGSTGGSELDEHDNGDTINRSRDRGEEGSQNGEEQARRSVARSEYSGNEQRPGDYIVEWGGTPSGIVSVFEWSSGRWVQRQHLVRPVFSHRALSNRGFAGTLFVMGGFGHDGKKNDEVEQYQYSIPETDQCHRLPNKKQRLESSIVTESSVCQCNRRVPAGAAAVLANDGNYIYVLGGYERGSFSAAAHRWDRTTGQWERIHKMCERRTDFAAGCLHDGSIIVAGGSDGEAENYLSTAEIYCPATHRWSSLPSMPTGRGYTTGCVLEDGRFLVVGGRTSRRARSWCNAGVVWNPFSTSKGWTPTPPLLPMIGDGDRDPFITACSAGLGAAAIARENDGILQVDLLDANNHDPLRWRWHRMPSAGPQIATSLATLY